MGIRDMNQKQIEIEWQKMIKAESAYLNRNVQRETAFWQDRIAKYVPDKFENTLKEGFFKAFQLIFDKGTGVIEKTYDKEKKEQDYKIRKGFSKVSGEEQSCKRYDFHGGGCGNGSFWPWNTGYPPVFGDTFKKYI